MPFQHYSFSNPTESRSQTITLSLAAKQQEQAAVKKRRLQGTGWGSIPASELVLNNLLYITVKFGNEDPIGVRQLWCALIESWPTNIRIVIHYLYIMCTLAPDTLATYVSVTKRPIK